MKKYSGVEAEDVDVGVNADSDAAEEAVEVGEVERLGESILANIVSSKSLNPVHIVHVAPGTKRGSEVMSSLQPVGASYGSMEM